MNSAQNRRHRFSTAVWVEQFTRKSESHKELLLKSFEEIYSSHSVDPDERPVNILCLDGGGMKGYALPTILKIIQERYGDKEPNILSLFDLVAGTSVGGAVALACNTMKTVQAACDEFEDGADDIREYTFSNMYLKNLFRTGDAVQEKNQMIELYKSRCGHKPLLNPGGPPAFALAAARGKSNSIRKRSTKAYEPLILRTYEYPDDSITNGSQCKALADSVSSLTLAESIAATTAMPAVVHRIKVPIDDKDVHLADGGLYGNCPISFAIDEIRRLYPRRPVGVILSIGYNSETPEEDLIYQAVQTARKVNPGIHFQRLVPHEITGDFNTVETSLERVVQMEDEIEDFFETNSKAAIALDETMKKIFAQERPMNKYAIEVGSFEYNLRDKMLSSDIYLERKKRRSDIRTRLQESRTMAEGITKERNIQPAFETVSLKDQRDGSNIVAIDVEKFDDSITSDGLNNVVLEAYSEDFDVIASDGKKDCILTEERKLDWILSCMSCTVYSCCQQTSSQTPSDTEESTDDDDNILDIVALSMERSEDTSEESSLSVDDDKDPTELAASHIYNIANKKDPMPSKADGNCLDSSTDTRSLSPSSSNSSEESANDAESDVNNLIMTEGYEEDATKLSQSMDCYDLELPPCIEDGSSRNCPLSSTVDGYTYDDSIDIISSTAPSRNDDQSIVSTIRSLFSY